VDNQSNPWGRPEPPLGVHSDRLERRVVIPGASPATEHATRPRTRDDAPYPQINTPYYDLRKNLIKNHSHKDGGLR
jgi:hypothetical protein